MLPAPGRLPWFVCACALLALAGCGGAKSRYASHMQRGEQYLAAGVLDKAGVEFRNALQIEPRDARARYLSGRVAEKRGNIREALGSYQGALDVDPDYAAAQAALGRVLVFGGAAERALKVIAPGLGKHPDDPQLLTVRAAARVQLQDVPGALADAEHAARVAPDDADSVALLASLYQRQGDTTRAINVVAAAVARQPDSSIDLRQVLASLYLGNGEAAKCEQQLTRIVALAPRELGHRYALAAFYTRAGNTDAAQQVLEAAVRALPASSAAKLALVEFVAQHRSREQGEKTLRGYIAREPDNDDLRLGLGTLLQRAGAAQDATVTYNEIIERDPKSATALIARDRIAAVQLAGGHVAEAKKLIGEVLAQNPRDSEALLMRGTIAVEHDDPTQAIADLRAVLRDQPNALNVQRTLARAYVANGESALAEETLRAAAQAAPADTAVHLDLAQLLMQTGRADAAVTLLEDSVRRAPADASARQALVRAYVAKPDLNAARNAAADLKTLQPTAAIGPYLAGLVAQQQNRLDDAQREFEHALQLQPEAMDALSALTRLQLLRGQGASATARVRAFSQAHPGNPYALNLLGETLVATKAYPAAVEQLTKTIALAPGWPLPYHNLAMARLGAHEDDAAISAYQAGLKAAPFEPGLAAELAALYEQQGNIDAAIAQYEGVCAHHPRLELAANNLAMLLVTYRTDRQSLDRARELTKAFASSSSGALLDTHGWVRLKLGDVTDALPVLERAVGRSPDSKVIRYHLAMAEIKAGQRDKARTNLETALAGAARFAGSDDARATLNSLTTGNTG
ncbi:MAG: PEP-CTERM system TPR-repeat protein PrsT [Steroidobacteraceae bacterium]